MNGRTAQGGVECRYRNAERRSEYARVRSGRIQILRGRKGLKGIIPASHCRPEVQARKSVLGMRGGTGIELEAGRIGEWTGSV